MKPSSIKTRITLWITLLVVALFSLMLLFAWAVSSSVVQRTARQQLADTVRANAAFVSLGDDGKLATAQGFAFSRGGVTSLVYSKTEALLAGQLPVGFSGAVPFENGTVRTVEAAGGDWYLLDLWVAHGWEDGVWLREHTSRQAVELVNRALDSGRLSLRGADRAMRLAWTLADMRGGTSPDRQDMAQGIALRTRMR